MKALVEYATVHDAWSRLSSVRSVTLGGEALPPSLVHVLQQRLHPLARVLNTYGPAECSIVSTYWECTAADGAADALTVPIGRPLPNYLVAVVDANLNATPVGVVGELCIGGAGVFVGYLGREDLTSSALVDLRHVHAGMGRAYRTGDLVRMLADGTLLFVGRKDHQVFFFESAIVNFSAQLFSSIVHFLSLFAD
jgi:non-ribosomal peptide synthetase component F